MGGNPGQHTKDDSQTYNYSETNSNSAMIENGQESDLIEEQPENENLKENEDIERGKDGTTSEATLTIPSVSLEKISKGDTYTVHSDIPISIKQNLSIPVTLGVDEAGRGPVLGPMVYGVAYCPSTYEGSLTARGFDDSKKLTSSVRYNLMTELCTATTDINKSVGWAVRVMSARDIAAGMLKPPGYGVYNLNAQAHDATILLITEVLAKGINVKEIYVDTVGPPATYQAKLSRVFPYCKVTVSKKADSLYPSVSVASIVAKVTRDLALELYFQSQLIMDVDKELETGSGYPSDPKTIAWLKGTMDPVFGWGSEARFSWSTTAAMLKKDGEMVDWPDDDDDGNMNITSFIGVGSSNGFKSWYGNHVDKNEF